MTVVPETEVEPDRADATGPRRRVAGRVARLGLAAAIAIGALFVAGRRDRLEIAWLGWRARGGDVASLRTLLERDPAAARAALGLEVTAVASRRQSEGGGHDWIVLEVRGDPHRIDRLAESYVDFQLEIEQPGGGLVVVGTLGDRRIPIPTRPAPGLWRLDVPLAIFSSSENGWRGEQLIDPSTGRLRVSSGRVASGRYRTTLRLVFDPSVPFPELPRGEPELTIPSTSFELEMVR